MVNQKRIYRSLDDRVVAGVCGGVAEYFKIDPNIVRIVWLLFSLFGASGIIAYLIGVIVIPNAPGGRISEYKSQSYLWLGIIIVVAIVLLFQHASILHMIWNHFWGFAGNTLLAIIFLFLIIYFIYSRKPDLFRKSTKSGLSSLHLSSTDRKISGVCGGIAESLNVDSTLVRFFWVLGTILTGGIGVLLYIALVFLLPTYFSND